ncbi:hypothetical protein DVS28_b0295 (plasmid) [Euzebya pacifica]|uniref:Uncharacterized protein n=1 Tax=Euzebya pacifica TaxID=1608957 RepID=A0A346Y6G8_9ACTN|nr:hypothetical protein DVS28_b0295 [Euzebya pacifica]
MNLSDQVPAHDYVESIRAQAIDSVLSMLRPACPEPRAA